MISICQKLQSLNKFCTQQILQIMKKVADSCKYQIITFANNKMNLSLTQQYQSVKIKSTSEPNKIANIKYCFIYLLFKFNILTLFNIINEDITLIVMSVSLSVHYQQLRSRLSAIMLVNHCTKWPSIVVIDHHPHWPSSLSTIILIDHSPHKLSCSSTNMHIDHLVFFCNLVKIEEVSNCF